MSMKNYAKEDHNVNIRRAQKIARISFLTILVLALVKIFSGVLFGSSGLIADGLHSLLDSILILTVIIIVSFITREPSEKFPYGYYKAEDLTVLFLSIFFLVMAMDLIHESLSAIIAGEYMLVNPLAAIIAFCSGAISYTIGTIQERVARSANISSLLLNSREMKYDSISSGFVGASIVLGNSFGIPLDKIAAIILGFVVSLVALRSLKDATLSLLDAWNRPQIMEKVRGILLALPRVRGVRMIRLRKAGPIIFGDAIILVDEKLDVEEAHRLADEAEETIKREVPNIFEILIHIEPARRTIYNIAIPVELSGEKAEISEHFGRASYLMIVEVNTEAKTHRLREIVNNPFTTERDKAGIKTVRLLVAKGIDAIITRNIGDTAYFLLRGHNIKIYRADTPIVDKAIEGFLYGMCRELDAPTRQRDMERK